MQACVELGESDWPSEYVNLPLMLSSLFASWHRALMYLPLLTLTLKSISGSGDAAWMFGNVEHLAALRSRFRATTGWA